MTNNDTYSPLHPVEISLLKSLVGRNKQSIEELRNDTLLGIDQIRRGIEWLKLKGLINLDEANSA